MSQMLQENFDKSSINQKQENGEMDKEINLKVDALVDRGKDVEGGTRYARLLMVVSNGR